MGGVVCKSLLRRACAHLRIFGPMVPAWKSLMTRAPRRCMSHSSFTEDPRHTACKSGEYTRALVSARERSSGASPAGTAKMPLLWQASMNPCGSIGESAKRAPAGDVRKIVVEFMVSRRWVAPEHGPASF